MGRCPPYSAARAEYNSKYFLIQTPGELALGFSAALEWLVAWHCTNKDTVNDYLPVCTHLRVRNRGKPA
jgi:hypothetical protein